ncbi:RNA polymerase-associated protein LEO1 [Cryptococcus gattii NT-10]|nr:RNA polymerase-associated protein LEO1 [Cryptococcus gattii NT-10]
MSDSESAADLFGDEEGSRRDSPIPQKSPSPKLSHVSNDEEQDAGDLFGDDTEEDEPQRRRRSTDTAASGSRSPHPLEYVEEDEEAVPQRQNVVTLPIPQWPHMTATDGKVWQMKFPAYINLDPKPFDSDLYRATQEEEPIDGAADPIAAKSMMIGVKNTIRWRWVTGPDGEPVRQSNARMLRWSDGSVTLQLGDDFYDVAPSQSATLARPSDPQPVPKRDDRPAVNSSTTFLCVGAAAERVLVTERPIAGQLSLLPTSMTSKTYLELVKHVGQQHTKHSKMKMLEETQDEEALQALLLKSAPNREAIKGVKSTVRRTSSKTGLGKGKKTRKIGYSDSESDAGFSADERRPRRRPERESVVYDDDDGFIVADSDEDDYASKKKKGKDKNKKRKGFTDDEESLDEMEEAERRIEERERERKRARKEKGGPSKKSREYVDTEDEEDEEAGDDDAEGEEEMDMDMDVESEED